MRARVLVGRNIKRLRTKQGLSQEKLAAVSGIDMRYLGAIERGQANPTVDVIEGIAMQLGVQTKLLFSDGRST